MIARSRLVALAATVVLAAGAACQAQSRDASGRSGPSGEEPRGFTLVASGDILPHTSIIERARFDSGGTGYDFRPMFAGVKSVVSRADLALCHMGIVYGEKGKYTGYPLFKSPPEVAQGLAATGYDGCSTASDHSLDDGAGGIQRTLKALDRAKVRYAGTARTEGEARKVTVLRAGPAKVAHLAYTNGVNGTPSRRSSPGRST